MSDQNIFLIFNGSVNDTVINIPAPVTSATVDQSGTVNQVITPRTPQTFAQPRRALRWVDGVLALIIKHLPSALGFIACGLAAGTLPFC